MNSMAEEYPRMVKASLFDASAMPKNGKDALLSVKTIDGRTKLWRCVVPLWKLLDSKEMYRIAVLRKPVDLALVLLVTFCKKEIA